MAQRSPGLASPRLLGWTLQMAASVVRCRRAFWRLLGRRAVARHVLVMSSWVQRPHGHGSRHPGPRHAPSGQGPVALARCARPHRPRACARRGHSAATARALVQQIITARGRCIINLTTKNALARPGRRRLAIAHRARRSGCGSRLPVAATLCVYIVVCVASSTRRTFGSRLHAYVTRSCRQSPPSNHGKQGRFSCLTPQGLNSLLLLAASASRSPSPQQFSGSSTCHQPSGSSTCQNV